MVQMEDPDATRDAIQLNNWPVPVRFSPTLVISRSDSGNSDLQNKQSERKWPYEFGSNVFNDHVNVSLNRQLDVNWNLLEYQKRKN